MLIAIMLMLTMMAGCGGGEDAKSADTASTQETFLEEEAAEQEDAVKATEMTKAEADSDKQIESKSLTKESSKQSTKTETDSNKETKSKIPTKESAKEPTEATTSATTATEAKKVCYITVEGYCSSKQIQLKGGESVYDILKKTGAGVSARSTGYGVYVEGINGRFEFDEGPTSGWIYTVNGSRPSTSCSNYSVSSGDKIVWTYVEEI